MRIIASRPDCRVYDIAEALSISTASVSKLVNSIEASGYCRRRPNPGDRRSSIIELTPAGRRALAPATKTFEAELELRLGSARHERALKQFMASLDTLAREWSALYGLVVALIALLFGWIASVIIRRD